MKKNATAKRAPRAPLASLASQQTIDIHLTRDELIRNRIADSLQLYDPFSTRDFQYRISRILSEIERTETGNAIRFATRYGHICKYVPEPDKWFVWNGQKWEKDMRGFSRQFAKKTAAHIELEAELIPPPLDSLGNPLMLPKVALTEKLTAEQEELIRRFKQHEEAISNLKKWALTSRSTRAISNILENAKDEPDMTKLKEEFDQDDYLINLKNGVFDLRRNVLTPHRAEFFMTLQADVLYNKSATCPEWDKFLNKITKNRPNIIRFLRQLAGMFLSGVRVEDLFVVFYGNGSNGKSVFMEVLRRILGSYAITASPQLFLEKHGDGPDFELARLDGIRALFKDEGKQGKPLDLALVKTLTGGNPIPAAFKFKDYFDYLPKFTPVFATNHRPRITENDNGIWRRLKLIPFEHNFDQDPERITKEQALEILLSEASGIFNWMIAGFNDYQQNGVYTPPEIVEATNEYRRDSDIFQMFIDDCCICSRDKEDKTCIATKAELYLAYQNYIEKDSGGYALNKANFGEELKRRGYRDRKTGALGWHWLGIRLRTDQDQQDQDQQDQDQQESDTEVY